MAAWARWRKRFADAGHGVAVAVATQPTLRVHLVATVVVLGAGAWLRVTPAEMAVLVLTCAVVIALEIMNTAIEVEVKAHTDRPADFARWALDMGAGAVLAASIGAVVVGVLILGPRLIDVLRGAGVL